MDNLSQGIPKVCVYLDDILISVANVVKHLRNLQEVLSCLRNQAGSISYELLAFIEFCMSEIKGKSVLYFP